jgi:hypothetical protein
MLLLLEIMRYSWIIHVLSLSRIYSHFSQVVRSRGVNLRQGTWPSVSVIESTTHFDTHSIAQFSSASNGGSYNSGLIAGRNELRDERW